MNKQRVVISLVFAGLVGLASVILVRAQSNYKLGAPGVIVGQAPLFDKESNVVQTTSVLLPNNLPGFSVTAPAITKPELDMLPVDTTFGRRGYTATNGFQALINVVLMGTDRTSIHKPEYCLPGQGWHIDNSEVISIPMSNSSPRELKATKFTVSTLRRNPEGKEVEWKGLYIFWFVDDNLTTPSYIERMYLMAKEMLTTGTLQRWAYIAYFSVCSPGQENALLAQMKSFISETVPKFQKNVSTVGESVSTNESQRMADVH